MTLFLLISLQVTFYVNVQRKRLWIHKDEFPQPPPKVELYRRKVMLCVWWDHRGILHFKFESAIRHTVDLRCVHENLQGKRFALVNGRNFVLFQDNAKLCSARVRKEKIMNLGRSVLFYSLYLADLIPSNFYLFRTLQNARNGKFFLKKIRWKHLWKTPRTRNYYWLKIIHC